MRRRLIERRRRRGRSFRGGHELADPDRHRRDRYGAEESSECSQRSIRCDSQRAQWDEAGLGAARARLARPSARPSRSIFRTARPPDRPTARPPDRPTFRTARPSGPPDRPTARRDRSPAS
jgi:hypothetical protein